LPEVCLVCREHSGDVPVPGGLLVVLARFHDQGRYLALGGGKGR